MRSKPYATLKASSLVGVIPPGGGGYQRTPELKKDEVILVNLSGKGEWI